MGAVQKNQEVGNRCSNPVQPLSVQVEVFNLQSSIPKRRPESYMPILRGLDSSRYEKRRDSSDLGFLAAHFFPGSELGHGARDVRRATCDVHDEYSYSTHLFTPKPKAQSRTRR